MRGPIRSPVWRGVDALVVGAVLVVAAAAQANSTSQLSTTADWTTLQVSVAGAPPSYGGQSTIAQGTAGYADSGLPSDNVNVSGWGAATAQVVNVNVLGRGSASTTFIRAEGNATADGVHNTYGRGAAYVYRIGYFPANATGTIQASITFDLSQFFQYAVATDNVGGYTEFNIGLGRVNPSTGITETIARTTDSFSHYSGNGDQNGTWTDQRTLTVSAAGDVGFTYAVDVFVYVDATAGTPAIAQRLTAVPLSPLLPLLLAAGVGAAALLEGRRRR